MPGLVGATFRKGGALADFRKDISYVNSPANPQDGSHEETLITLKLFNLVARELGPHLLTQGVWIDDRSLMQLISRISPYINIEDCQWNGRKIPSAQLSGIDWPRGWIDLTVSWQPPM